tara:strand:+ start:166 stop:579 length:414 start_codon:yes stop_codon:yes gene_type:complete
MLLNVSYKDPKQEQTITDLVGKPFSLRERIKFSGVGSPKLQIVSSSPKISNLLLLDNNLDMCNIEIRPKGIIVRFRSLLETYAMVIPFYKLSVFKGKSASYSVHADEHKIEVRSDKHTSKFFSKIMGFKAKYIENPR